MSVELDTRAKLLNATIDAISSGGEGSVRVSNVASVVGVREPSVYHFFKNREALVEAAQIERYRRSYSEMMVPFEAAALMADSWDDFERSVRKIFAVIYTPARAEIRSVRMNVMGAAQTSPAIAAAVNEINLESAQSLARVMTFGQEKGWVTKDLDAMALAYWGIGQINGRVMAEMNPSQVDLEAWTKVSIEAVLSIYCWKEPK
ncbi:MAG: TetR/AcrR family transcriptional regulator [Ilumatobacteraceae bacterium]